MTASPVPYRCPGESEPISAAVHRARQAVGYDACKRCVFGGDSEVPSTVSVPRSKREVGIEGLRERYLSPLTRGRVAEYVSAFCELLWDAKITRETSATPLAHRRRSPRVCIAHDERPASGDLLLGALSALARQGIDVQPVERATLPALRNAVDRVGAEGGVYLTGSGTAPVMHGLEFCLQRGMPLPLSDADLAFAQECQTEHESLPFPSFHWGDVHRRARGGATRRSRGAGRRRTPLDRLEEHRWLRERFVLHPARRLVITSPSTFVLDSLAWIGQGLPGEWSLEQRPITTREPMTASSPEAKHLADRVRTTGAELGIAIDDNAEGVWICDASGRLLDPIDIATLLVVHRFPNAELLVSDDREQAASHATLPTRLVPASRFACHHSLLADEHTLAVDSHGRFWLPGPVPNCDALRTLAELLAIRLTIGTTELPDPSFATRIPPQMSGSDVNSLTDIESRCRMRKRSLEKEVGD